MKQEDKTLLIKDLCARIPYGVKFNFNGNIRTLTGIDKCVDDNWNWTDCVCAIGISPIEIEFCKPYLFPISSMTEEQSKIYHELIRGMFGTSALINIEEFVNWCNKNHLDWRGLIPKGLAIDATRLNIY